jgi:hypothetical protein
MITKSLLFRYIVSFAAFLLVASMIKASSFDLEANPNYSFGSVAPTSTTMATAIQTRLGKPISIVGSLANENTSFPPVLADSGVTAHPYGPAANGVIQDLNLQTSIVTGIVSGQLRASGTEISCSVTVTDFVLRVFTQTQFHDVDVKVFSCNGGMGNAFIGWDFYKVSGPRTIPGPVVLASCQSTKAHGTGGPVFNVSLPQTGTHGIECRSGGANNQHIMLFTFLQTLTSVQSAAVTSGTGSVSSASISGTDAHKYNVNLTNVANAQYLVVTLSNVNDSQGNHSDTVSVPMDVLLADTSANGKVNSSDVSQTQTESGQPLSASNFRTDVNASGAINSSDVSTVQAQSGTSLP